MQARREFLGAEWRISMTDKKMLFVYNPFAGKASIKGSLSDIIDTFTKGGYEVTVYPTQCKGDGVQMIEDLSGEYDIIGCSGGDGTLGDVVRGMMRRTNKIPIGYIPAGSTNDFGKSVEIPSNMINAATKIVSGKRFSCDIGAMNNDYFVYVAAFGLFTDVSYETDQQAKNALGHLAYVIEGAKRLNAVESYPLKITWDEGVIEDTFVLGMVTNSKYVGGFKNITGSDIAFNDGKFEVTLIKKPATIFEARKVIAALLGGKDDPDNMYRFKSSKLKVESENPVSWTLDGEFGGEHTNVTIENINEAIDLIV